MINPDKKLEDMTEKLDDILNWLTDSPMDNEDYNTIHKIFDKYLEIEEQRASRKENMTNKDITILWGTEAVKGIDPIKKGYNKKTYQFENKEQFNYFMKGVDEANGWLEYEVQE